MDIQITLGTTDDGDVDASHEMGITSAAYDRLMAALMSAGFEVVDGPTQM